MSMQVVYEGEPIKLADGSRMRFDAGLSSWDNGADQVVRAGKWTADGHWDPISMSQVNYWTLVNLLTTAQQHSDMELHVLSGELELRDGRLVIKNGVFAHE
jgi:hypothetical protein